MFSSLGSGCDQCADVSDMFGNNNNIPYQTMMNSLTGSNVVQAGCAVNNASMTAGGAVVATPMMMPSTTVVTGMSANGQQIKQQQQQVAGTAGPGAVVITKEGFVGTPVNVPAVVPPTVSNMTPSMNLSKNWIILGLVILSALSANECTKYFLNKSLQLNDGSPMYYVAYVGLAVLLTYAVWSYTSKM